MQFLWKQKKNYEKSKTLLFQSMTYLAPLIHIHIHIHSYSLSLSLSHSLSLSQELSNFEFGNHGEDQSSEYYDPNQCKLIPIFSFLSNFFSYV